MKTELDPPNMTRNQVKQAICRDVCVQFAENGSSISLRDLAIPYGDPDAILELKDAGFIEGLGDVAGIDEAYIPRLSAFVLAGDDGLLQLITSRMVLAVAAVKRLYIENEIDLKSGANFNQVFRRELELEGEPEVNERKLQLGILFASENGSLGSCGRNKERSLMGLIFVDH